LYREKIKNFDDISFLLHKKVCCVNNEKRVFCISVFFKRSGSIMMQHSPMMKILGITTWAITAFVSINMLTMMYGYDMLGGIVGMMPAMEMAIIWIIGLSGLISLAMLIKACFMCCPGCGACPCTCNANNYNKM
jgi:uncharacterized membrane protein YuzA (DUF378 family)